MASVARQRLARSRIEESTARGGWGDSSSSAISLADEDGPYGGIPGYSHAFILVIFCSYEDHFSIIFSYFELLRISLLLFH